MFDNYGREAAAYLPEIKISGIKNPVFQVIDESQNEILYSVRKKGNTFRPKVFKEGIYTLVVGNPDEDKMKTIHGIKSIPQNQDKKLKINFK